MIYPSAIDCLKTVEYTLEHTIKPALTGTSERSALATVNHLVRHVACRIEREGEVLCADIQALRTVLTELRAYAARSSDVVAGIDAATARTYRAPGAYPSLISLAEEAGALREAFVAAQTWVIETGPAQTGEAEYQRIRARIRGYIARQLTGEAELIEPAFFGHGPRR